MTVQAQTSYFVSASYFDRKPLNVFERVVIVDDIGRHKITPAALFVAAASGMSHHV